MLLTFKKITVIDHAVTGQKARTWRKKMGFSLREVARRMKMTPPYLSDIELGKRNWNQSLADKFIEAIEVNGLKGGRPRKGKAV